MLGLDANLTRAEMDPLPFGLTIRSDVHATVSAREARNPDGFRAEIDYIIGGGGGLSSGPVSADAFPTEKWAESGRTDDDIPWFPNEDNPSDHVPVGMSVTVAVAAAAAP